MPLRWLWLFRRQHCGAIEQLPYVGHQCLLIGFKCGDRAIYGGKDHVLLLCERIDFGPQFGNDALAIFVTGHAHIMSYLERYRDRLIADGVAAERGDAPLH